MAETLASTLNQPVDPFSIVGQVSRRPSITERGAAARGALEPTMRAQEAASSEARRLEREGAEKIAQGEVDLARGEVRAIESAQKAYKEQAGEAPVRNVQDFNPDAAMELAALTAIMGAFVGLAGGGGRGALAALEGVTNGYKEGQQDLYEREIKKYESELQAYKDRLNTAKQTYDNVIKLETAKKGAGAAELKRLETQIAGTAGEAQARAGNLQAVGEFIKEALKTADAIEQKRIEAGMGAASLSITDIVNPNNPTEVLRIDAKQYRGGGAGSPGVIGLVPPKQTEQKVREDEQKTAYNTSRILTSAQQIAQIVARNAEAEAPGSLEALVSSLPLIDAATNVVRGADRQIVASAQADIIDSLLFLATGAAYNKEQLAQQRLSYLPLWSDKEQAVAAKRDRLRGLIEGAKIRSGAAWRPEMDTALESLFIKPPGQGAQTSGQPAPAPTQQGASQEITQRPGESRLEFLRRKRDAGAF